MADVFTEQRLVGAYVPHHLADYLGLLALYKHTNRSDLIRIQVEELEKTNKKIPDMIKTLARRAIVRWWNQSSRKPLSYEEYEKRTQRTLQKRKISNTHIQQILEEMRELKRIRR